MPHIHTGRFKITNASQAANVSDASLEKLLWYIGLNANISYVDIHERLARDGRTEILDALDDLLSIAIYSGHVAIVGSSRL